MAEYKHCKCEDGKHVLIEGMSPEQDDRKIISFLYSLMRDHITPGYLEQIIQEICKYPDETCYTNGYLVEYARNMAKRLDCLQGGDKE